MAFTRPRFTILRLFHAMAWFAVAAWLASFGIPVDLLSIPALAGAATVALIGAAAIWGRAWLAIIFAPTIVILLIAISIRVFAGP
ncbi:MAG TPA: hypothetical protein VGN12_25680 [Pirellulales bacterium]|jgi:hypothetical protein